MSFTVLNAYHIMWLIIFFDLPVLTKKQRKEASQFRKTLEKYGFHMMQLSVYMRHCPSKEIAEAQINRVKQIVPLQGKVSILKITDKQYGNIINYCGKERENLPSTPLQLELF